MIEKMEFFSVTGEVGDIDRITSKYLSKYEVHFENALTELSDVPGLKPYSQPNPYTSDLFVASSLADRIAKEVDTPPADVDLSEALDAITDIDSKVADMEEELSVLRAERKEIVKYFLVIAPFRKMPCNISELQRFKNIVYRFGKIPVEYYAKLQKFVHDSPDIIFYECEKDERFVWGLYFVPVSRANRVDSIFSLIHFETLEMPDDYYDNSDETYSDFEERLKENKEAEKKQENDIHELIDSNAGVIRCAEEKLGRLSRNFDIRKKAACKDSEGKNSFILCGWMAEDDLDRLEKDLKDDERAVLVKGSENDKAPDRVPTKLKNPALFRPYEMYTEMYGLPAYNEMDPTIFIAITYSFIFGIMYGDLGQGLCLLIGGFLLYKFKHIKIAGIIACAGLFSSIFGLLFGSFFGFEHVIPTLWLKPREAMYDIPVIGRMNTVFVYAIGFGMMLLIVCMILNVRNCIKRKRLGEALFSSNTVAGIIFYGTLAAVAALFITGRKAPAGWLLGILFGVPVLCMFLKEPLVGLLEKKKGKLIEGSVGMFICESFFELFEMMLGLFSNTISFIRIGAFAVSHAAMMEVVMMLAGAENGGSINWIAVVIGNIFVMGLEGLIVGIQVLRLEYYEMFSRFYNGSGKPFVPFFEKRSAAK